MNEPLPTRRAAHLLIITLILLLAAAMRILGTADRPVWTDEGWSVWAASDHAFSAVVDRVGGDHHPPIYFAALSGWWSLAGDSRIALRFPAILGGVLAAAAVYRIGADGFGSRAGHYAALLFAVMGLAVYYAQEIRHYGWLVLAVSLMSLFFLRYLRRPRWPIWALYMLSVWFMLGTLYVGGMVLAVQAVTGLLLWRGRWRDKAALVAAWIGAILLCAPWWRIIPDQLGWFRHASSTFGVPFAYTITFDNLMMLTDALLGYQFALVGGAYLLGVWGIGRGFARSDIPVGATLQSRPGRVNKPDPTSEASSQVGQAHLYLLLAGGGLYILLILMNLRVETLTLRTLAFLTPLIAVIAGYGLSRIAQPAQTILAALAVIGMMTLADTVQPRIEYDNAAESVAADYARGDLIILETGWDDNAFRYELALAVADPDPFIIRTLPWVDPGSIAPVVPQVEPAIRAHDRVWVVRWLTPSQVMPWLDSSDAGFRRVLAWEESIGQAYITRYPDYPPAVQIALYERPDLSGEPQVFGDRLALYDAVIAESASPGERLHVDLWWSAADQTGTLDRDYSVGVYLMPADEDRVIAQHDSPPGDTPTSQWHGDTLHFDRHTLIVPEGLVPGVYRVAVSVYWFGDGVRLPVKGSDTAVVADVRIP